MRLLSQSDPGRDITDEHLYYIDRAESIREDNWLACCLDTPRRCYKPSIALASPDAQSNLPGGMISSEVRVSNTDYDM